MRLTIKWYMYEFVFYFFYRILSRKGDDDSLFSSILCIFLIVGLHIVAVLKICAHFNNIEGMPVFSGTYLHNKLYWFLPLGVVLGIVYLYFNKSKTKRIIEKYSAKEDFFSLANIALFLIVIIVPALVVAKL